MIANKKIKTKFLASGFLLIFIAGCQSKNDTLINYYQNNSALHQELSDSLMSFSKRYHTDIVIKKNNSPKQNISFSIHFRDSAAFIPVYFDKDFKRIDHQPERTGNFIIPLIIIEEFKSSIYIGIGADSVHTFFAHKWDKPRNPIGTSGDSQYGILILKDTAGISKMGDVISSNACITHNGIF